MMVSDAFGMAPLSFLFSSIERSSVLSCGNDQCGAGDLDQASGAVGSGHIALALKDLPTEPSAHILHTGDQCVAAMVRVERSHNCGTPEQERTRTRRAATLLEGTNPARLPLGDLASDNRRHGGLSE